MFTLFRTLVTADPKSILRIFAVFVLAFSGFLLIEQMTENVELAVARQARPFLGADITISTSDALSGSLLEKLKGKLDGSQYQATEKTEFYTTLFDSAGKTGLVRVIAFE
jgi:predicted lysophospholipase L1 biosynthesis ABC-type transport system permease subunit